MMRVVPPSRRSLRVLHTADVHLDGDGSHRDRDRAVLRAIVDRALADAVDLVLIAGDLFDHNRVPDDTVAYVRAELDRFRRPIVILPGNHDCLQRGGVFDRHDFTAAAPHVRLIRRLEGERVELPDLDAVVWGRGMTEHDLVFSPLGGLPRRDDARWCLAMGHGFYFDERQRPDRSSPIFAEEIRESGWDYIALGHQHVRTDVSQGGVTAYYAGAPLFEPGDGVVLRVDLSPDTGVRVEPRPL